MTDSLDALLALLAQAKELNTPILDAGLVLDKLQAELVVQALSAHAQSILDITTAISTPHDIEFSFGGRRLYIFDPRASYYGGAGATKESMRLSEPCWQEPTFWDSSQACSSNVWHKGEE